MFKYFVLAAILAYAAADPKPAVATIPVLTHYSSVGTPAATIKTSYAAAPVAYTAPLTYSAPISYSAPVAYNGYKVASPYAYTYPNYGYGYASPYSYYY